MIRPTKVDLLLRRPRMSLLFCLAHPHAMGYMMKKDS
jgi:hypothetical protein